MTEEHVRQAVIRSAIASFTAGQDCHYCTHKGLVPPRLMQARQAAIDAALEAVLPAVAELVQQALEEGFDGRADAGRA